MYSENAKGKNEKSILHHHQTTSAQITAIHPAQHFKTSVGVQFTCIICSYKGA
jgi:hypothetical protein